jgi:DnaK suppressor protein
METFMATQRSEKKKKKAPAKKPPVNLKKKKKLINPKPPKKKMIKKPVKPAVKTKIPSKGPPIKATKDAKEGIRKLLLAMRDKLVKEISENRIPEPLTAPSNIGDLVDQAGDERDRELSLLLTGRGKEKLMAITEALEKINEGTYGICEECGEKIGQGRLKVMPLAKLCVSCQSKLEKEMSILRKTEEDLTYQGLAYATSIEEEET